MQFFIGLIIGVIFAGGCSLVIFALLNANGEEQPEKPAKLYTVGQTVLYDGQEWEIAQFNDLGDGQTGVMLMNENGRAYVMLEEVE